MLKKMMLWVAALLLGSSLAYAAPDRTGKWDVGVDVSAAIPTDSGIDNGVQVAGSVAYGVNDWWAVGFEGGWGGTHLKSVSDSGVTIHGTDVNGIPLFADIILRVPTGDKPFTPYGVIGLGTVIWNVDDTKATYSGADYGVTTDVKTSFALKLGGGLDWFINDHWIANFDAAYIFNRADVTEAVNIAGTNVSATERTKLDYWTVGGGLKYLF